MQAAISQRRPITDAHALQRRASAVAVDELLDGLYAIEDARTRRADDRQVCGRGAFADDHVALLMHRRGERQVLGSEQAAPRGRRRAKNADARAGTRRPNARIDPPRT